MSFVASIYNTCVSRWLRCLHCRLTARRSWVWFPHGALLVLGAGSPQAFSAQVGYLPGLSVWSLHVVPVFTRVYSTKKPSRRTELSVPDRDGRFTWSPGAEMLPTAPGGGTIRDGVKAEKKITVTSGLRVRVCV